MNHEELAEDGILEVFGEIRCPSCHSTIKTDTKENDMPDEIFCTICDDCYDIDDDNVVLLLLFPKIMR